MAIAYVGGIAARSERYMRDHWAFAKGFLDAAGLARSRAQEEQEFLEAQQAAGLGLVSPAYVAWEDLLRPLCDGKTAEVGALTRTFETNTFHRQPTLHGDPAATRFSAEWDALGPALRQPWVLTLPSPWDLAARSKDARAKPGKTAERALAFGRALNAVVVEARRRGARLVRFQDPSIAYRRAPERNVAASIEALAAAARGHEADCTLHLYNGDPFEVPDLLQGNPLRGLSLEDAGREPPRGLHLPNATRLTVALVRGEDSIVEDPAQVVRRAQEIAQRLGTQAWGLSNGWDLDHVPHGIALRKVAALGRAQALLHEVPA